MRNPALVGACDAWLALSEPAGESFSAVVKLALAMGTVSARDLADEFEAMVSTPERWADGTARPHPRMQRQIVKALRRIGRYEP